MSRTIPLADAQSGMIGLRGQTYWHIISIDEPWDARAHGLLTAVFDVWIEADKRWSRSVKTFNPNDPLWSITPLSDADVQNLFGAYL